MVTAHSSAVGARAPCSGLGAARWAGCQEEQLIKSGTGWRRAELCANALMSGPAHLCAAKSSWAKERSELGSTGIWRR